MNKKAYIAMLASSISMGALAQSAIDAQQITQSDFKGTARFMAMGGAFTALGGDLSVLNQNPAGIGVYRSNEVGVTVDFNFQNSKTSPSYAPNYPSSNSQTKVYCNNFGYVGSTNLSGALRTFNWGVSYNRAQTFDRIYQGYVPSTQTSLTNYVAAFSQGIYYPDMDFSSGYNPYYDSDIDWMSILSYSAYMINPVGNGTEYQGLFTNGTQGDALYSVRETGYVDEYDISFGGNVENLVYWGLTVGITDLNYTRSLYYSESMSDALVYSDISGSTAYGNAGLDLTSRKYINGSGWNLKLGVILKPVNEFRFGLAVHTPTWYKLNQGYDGTVDYSYLDSSYGVSSNNPLQGNDYTENAYFNWRLRSPWKLMAGVAGVIGGRAIVSLDYQYDAYGNMGVSLPAYAGGFQDGYEPDGYVNDQVSSYFKAANTVRLGLEYRVTPQFSVRAGYNVQDTNVKSEASNGQLEVMTSGTDCSYTFDKTTQYFSFGLGYRYQAWYIDATYVYKDRQSTFHAYSDFDGYSAPQSKLADHNSSLVISTGFKF